MRGNQVELKDICTSLELSKQLKTAGYPQESLFRWVKLKADWRLFSVWEWEGETGYLWDDLDKGLQNGGVDFEWYSAPIHYWANIHWTNGLYQVLKDNNLLKENK